ncbi:MAG: DUF4352 domain-containing protein [Lachnospiraceae bacterium]|nr:DUF4352 domain-containing protein [Lachnospiraceae bacterium]
MKRELWIALGCLTLGCLTACGSKGTPAESKWKAAQKAEDTASYVIEHGDELDELKPEAESAENLSQQFKAVALLCMAEYQDSLAANGLAAADNKDEDVFLFEYPNTSSYVDSYFSKVNTEGDAFWESLNDAYYPYDYFLPMMAATSQMDGQTLSALIQGMPSDSGYATKLKEAIEKWVKNKPGKVVAVGDALTEIGYFDNWNSMDWTGVYLYNSIDPYRIRTGTAEEALAYVRYMRDSFLPSMESKVSKDSCQSTSSITGEGYYSTGLAVTFDEAVTLSEPRSDGLPESIDLEGKTVVALYQNPTAGEDPDAPPSWRLLGDFLMELPDEEVPASLSEADYYFVLTAAHEFGNYYTDQSGKETKIQAVYSSTSIDLYDAATGEFLRHVGNVMENPSSSIFKDLNEESAQYPELIGADVLAHIYHNINDPDAYVVLLDNTSGMEAPLLAGGTGLLGQWEITFDSYEVVKSFNEGVFNYSASDGNQFLRGKFTVTNRGFQKGSFLPSSNYGTENPVYAVAMDAASEDSYLCVDAVTNSNCLNDKTIEPGETKSGEVIFELPDSVAGGAGPLYIAFGMGNQMLLFATGE